MDHRTSNNLPSLSGRHPGSQSSTASANHTYPDMRCYQSPLHQTAAAVRRFRQSHQGLLVADYDHSFSASQAMPNLADAAADSVLPPQGNGRSFPGRAEIVWIIKHKASTAGATPPYASAIPNLPHRGNGRSNPGAAEIAALARLAVPASSVDGGKTAVPKAADLGGLQESAIHLVCA